MDEASGGGERADATEHRVGATLRRLRKQKKMSLQALAQESGVSVSMISQVERGLANPSIRLLTALRRALNISMQEMFGESATLGPSAEPDGDPAFVRRAGKRPQIDLDLIHKELLTPTDAHHLQLMILTIAPGGESGGRALSYPAEKAALVLRGALTLHVGDQVATLHAGDSAVFDSARPHSLRNLGDAPVELLWIIGAVRFDRHL
ncbi:helix-turn-helix domain-containing protein [Paracoccus sediminicola]|uniref:helix-turn-helix domain-containing protein n=1 Tax=Paracoccus sediminicola TaxID=3017783 RepID=UPI0022F071D6|nr:cupin domain-containing protein [Paracoccus sediminicola]WBU57763.1 helix-turn-helix domain-containing protein [Paracoccus sediminicola]